MTRHLDMDQIRNIAHPSARSHRREKI
jgi:hypothetical protein